MDSPKRSQSEPVALLVREIENLQAQTRLMEICLQEAQAAREQSVAWMKEQYSSELSSLRASLTNEIQSARGENQALRARIVELEAAASSVDRVTPEFFNEAASGHLTDEITRLRSTLARQEYAAARQETLLKAQIDRLAAEIEQRREEVAQQREISSQAAAELERLRVEAAALTEKSRQSDLERAGEDRPTDSKTAPLGMAEPIAQLADRIHELQLRLGEKQSPTESRGAELVHLTAELKRIVERLAGPGSLAGARPGRAALNAPASGRRTEEKTMTPGDGNKPPEDALEAEQPSATPAGLEQSLRDEIERLLHESREKNRLLQDRNDELVRVKGEMDRLQERLNQWESLSSRAQSALAGDAERMHTEFQAQLALLQAELSQKQWALEEKEAAVRSLEQKYRQDRATRHRQMTPSDTELGGQSRASEAGLNPTREERAIAAKNAEELACEVHVDRSHRRWSSGFGRKRRWR
jgi:chromosome segregation ATPase